MKKAILASLVAATCAHAIPAAAANYFVVVPVSGKTVSRAAIQVTLSTGALPSVLRGAAYSYDFRRHLQVVGDSTYTGFGVKWAVSSGSLPPGLTLNASTGVLSGTPTASGNWPFAISATYMTKTGEQTYEVAVTSLTVTLDTATAPQALVGNAYSFNLAPLVRVNDPAFTGAGVTWTVVSSSLPAGLYLAADGRIAGTPTAGGTGSIVARATYRDFNGEQRYEVVALDIKVVLASATPPGGTVGDAYSYNLGALLSVSGDSAYKPADVTWSVASGTLPAGLTLNASTGLISGTPTAAGNAAFNVTATYRTKAGSQTYSLAIATMPAKSRWEQTTLDFGSVGWNGAEETRTAALYNDGGLAGTGWTTLSNLGSGVTADASACAQVAPGAFCQVTFRFTPSTVGQVNLTGIAPTSATRTLNTLAIKATAVQRVLNLSPAVNGRSSWNLDTDGPLIIAGAGSWTITPATSMAFSVKLWGAGGGGGGLDAAPVYSGKGGGAGYAAGQYKTDKNVSLTAIIGGGGVGGASSRNASGGGAGGYNGGGAGGNAGAVGGSGGGGGGGGRTELLRAGTIIACAGGGGGGGGDGNVTTNGGNDGNYTTGTTASKDGGTTSTRTDDGGGNGGGGGGCNGGRASTNYPEFDSNGEGGAAGQSIAPGLLQATTLAPGLGGLPANSGDAEVGTFARGGINATSSGVAGSGTAGILIIR